MEFETSTIGSTTSENIDRAISHVETQSASASPRMQSRHAMILHLDEKAAFPHVLHSMSDSNFGDDNVVPNHHLPLRPDHALNNSTNAPERYSKAISQLDTSTRIFLSDQGVLKLPRGPITHALLAVFFKHVHPHVPVVDKAALLRDYSARTCSPLLLNSMFALASNFADEGLVIAVGVGTGSSTGEMADHFVQKARLLADFGLEHDHETQLVSFLLLTQMWQTWTMERNPRYWIGRAMNVGVGMGLFRRLVPTLTFLFPVLFLTAFLLTGYTRCGCLKKTC